MDSGRCFFNGFFLLGLWVSGIGVFYSRGGRFVLKYFFFRDIE